MIGRRFAAEELFAASTLTDLPHYVRPRVGLTGGARKR